MNRYKEKNKGISLLEVLISIAIFGIVSSMISMLLMSGMRYFRKQSAVLELQNDAQIVTSSMTTAILEGTDFKVQTKTSGARMELWFDTGKKTYIWVDSAGDADDHFLYIYDTGGSVDYNRGNCISSFVTNLDIEYKSNGISVELQFRNSESSTQQSFVVKPRNTGAGFEVVE